MSANGNARSLLLAKAAKSKWGGEMDGKTVYLPGLTGRPPGRPGILTSRIERPD
ncbi:MAG TPA: hypothetical protein GXX40_05075 [Firmicutes bacterium]|nr:hypothetical protein [Bacillota bacterium]